MIQAAGIMIQVTASTTTMYNDAQNQQHKAKRPKVQTKIERDALEANTAADTMGHCRIPHDTG